MNIEKQIEFDKVKEIWSNLAVTERARNQIRELSFYLNETELRKQIKDTTNSRIFMEKQNFKAHLSDGAGRGGGELRILYR